MADGDPRDHTTKARRAKEHQAKRAAAARFDRALRPELRAELESYGLLRGDTDKAGFVREALPALREGRGSKAGDEARRRRKKEVESPAAPSRTDGSTRTGSSRSRSSRSTSTSGTTSTGGYESLGATSTSASRSSRSSAPTSTTNATSRSRSSGSSAPTSTTDATSASGTRSSQSSALTPTTGATSASRSERSSRTSGTSTTATATTGRTTESSASGSSASTRALQNLEPSKQLIKQLARAKERDHLERAKRVKREGIRVKAREAEVEALEKVKQKTRKKSAWEQAMEDDKKLAEHQAATLASLRYQYRKAHRDEFEALGIQVADDDLRGTGKWKSVAKAQIMHTKVKRSLARSNEWKERRQGRPPSRQGIEEQEGKEHRAYDYQAGDLTMEPIDGERKQPIKRANKKLAAAKEEVRERAEARKRAEKEKQKEARRRRREARGGVGTPSTAGDPSSDGGDAPSPSGDRSSSDASSSDESSSADGSSSADDSSSSDESSSSEDDASEGSSSEEASSSSEASSSGGSSGTETSTEASSDAMGNSEMVGYLKAKLPAYEVGLVRLKEQHKITKGQIAHAKRPPAPAHKAPPKWDLTWEDAVHPESLEVARAAMEYMIDVAFRRVLRRPDARSLRSEIKVFKNNEHHTLNGIARQLYKLVVSEVQTELIMEAIHDVILIHAAAHDFVTEQLVASLAAGTLGEDLTAGEVRFRLMNPRGKDQAPLRALTTPPGVVRFQDGTYDDGFSSIHHTPADLKARQTTSRPGKSAGKSVGESSYAPSTRRAYLESAQTWRDSESGGPEGQYAITNASVDEDEEEDPEKLKRQLHCEAIAGLLLATEEQKMKSGDAPGHSQPLDLDLPPAVNQTEAKVKSWMGLKPALLNKDARLGFQGVRSTQLTPADWSTSLHNRASAVEQSFFRHVALRPIAADEDGSVIEAATELGAITTFAVCPQGSMIALGTGRGTVLVYDIRDDEAPVLIYRLKASAKPPAPIVIEPPAVPVMAPAPIPEKKGLFGRKKRAPPPPPPPPQPQVIESPWDEDAPVLGISWSRNGNQICILDGTHTVSTYSLKPTHASVKMRGLLGDEGPMSAGVDICLAPHHCAHSGKLVRADRAAGVHVQEGPIGSPGGSVPADVAFADVASTRPPPSAAGSATSVDRGSMQLGRVESSTTVANFASARMMGEVITVAGGVGVDAAVALAEDVLAGRFNIWRPIFHANFTLSGWQPYVMVPQRNGDILRVANRDAPKAACMWELAADAVSARQRPMRQAAVHYVCEPEEPQEDAGPQVLYRGHDHPVVFMTFLPDSALCLTVDVKGTVALWPAGSKDLTGYGWFLPKSKWKFPPSMRSLIPTGPLLRVFGDETYAAPPPPRQRVAETPPTPTPPPQLTVKSKSRFRRKDPPPPQPPPRRRRESVRSMLPDMQSEIEVYASASSSDEEMSHAAKSDATSHRDPEGTRLLAGKVLWMTRKRIVNGEFLTEEYHRPRKQKARTDSSQVIVVSTYDDDGELVRRCKQGIRREKVSSQIVGAALTPAQHLLFVARVDEANSSTFVPIPHFSVHSLTLGEGEVQAPRIEIWDHSEGRLPPAFAVSPPISSLGSEYLFFGLAAATVGVYSLASGAQLSLIDLDGMPPDALFLHMELFIPSTLHGATSQANQIVMGAATEGSPAVHLYQVDISKATTYAMANKRGYATHKSVRRAAANAKGTNNPPLKPAAPRTPPKPTAQEPQSDSSGDGASSEWTESDEDEKA